MLLNKNKRYGYWLMWLRVGYRRLLLTQVIWNVTNKY
uniref:Uncharacterized protein n=1 Tax=Aegilops tauschii subsp. strangulata TaxID=200361 RepID=A0A452XQV5_AEGTS